MGGGSIIPPLPHIPPVCAASTSRFTTYTIPVYAL